MDALKTQRGNIENSCLIIVLFCSGRENFECKSPRELKLKCFATVLTINISWWCIGNCWSKRVLNLLYIPNSGLNANISLRLKTHCLEILRWMLEMFLLAFECQILRGARNWALLTLDNVENIVLYQVTMGDQFQN